MSIKIKGKWLYVRLSLHGLCWIIIGRDCGAVSPLFMLQWTMPALDSFVVCGRELSAWRFMFRLWRIDARYQWRMYWLHRKRRLRLWWIERRYGILRRIL